MCLVVRMIQNGSTNESSCVKSHQVGGVKLHGETQTAKLMEKGVNETNARVLGRTPDLNCMTLRITNLIKRNILHNRNFAE